MAWDWKKFSATEIVGRQIGVHDHSDHGQRYSRRFSNDPLTQSAHWLRQGSIRLSLDNQKTMNIVVITTMSRDAIARQKGKCFGERQMKLKPNIFPRIESPGFLIYRTATQMKVGLLRAFQEKGFNVTPEQWTVLSSLWEGEGLNQTLLAEKTLKDRHNITRILNLLEKGGLVRREPDSGDRRRQRVYLTEAGRALKPQLVRIVTDFLQKALTGMSQEDLNSMKRILAQILKNLGRDSKTAQGPQFGRPRCELSVQ